MLCRRHPQRVLQRSLRSPLLREGRGQGATPQRSSRRNRLHRTRSSTSMARRFLSRGAIPAGTCCHALRETRLRAPACRHARRGRRLPWPQQTCCLVSPLAPRCTSRSDPWGQSGCHRCRRGRARVLFRRPPRAWHPICCRRVAIARASARANTRANARVEAARRSRLRMRPT